MVPSEVTRDRLEFGAIGLRSFRVEAVIDMFVDQRPLGIRHGLFDRLELLRYIQARLAGLQHLDDRSKVTVGAFQPGDQGWVTCMDMRV